MRGRGKTISRAAVIVWLTASVAAGPAYAQSQPLKDWSLPAGPTATQTPTAQGPVDSQNPSVQSANPDLQNPEAPTPAPTINAPPPPPVAFPTPTTKQGPQPAVAASKAPAPSPSASSAAPSLSPAPDVAQPAPVSPAPSATAETPPPPAVAASSGWPLWWWAIPAALLALAGGLLLGRRRRAPRLEEEEQAYAPEEHHDEPSPPVAAPIAQPVPAPIPVPSFASAPPPVPSSAREAERACGQFEFVPTAMRISLVYATLQFRVVLTAQTEIPAGKLLGDMISAHGSLPQSLQLAPPPEVMRVVKAIPHLAAGETVELKGELQLPLNAIRPVHQGGASFMVPLVRLALVGDGEPGLPHLELGFVFTVGLPGTGTGVAPLRLDTGPREVAELSAREIEAARRTVLLPLDPARAAG